MRYLNLAPNIIMKIYKTFTLLSFFVVPIIVVANALDLQGLGADSGDTVQFKASSSPAEPRSGQLLLANNKKVTTRKSRGVFERDCLGAHNKWRQVHSSGPLKLDPKLTEFAQKRADFIAKSDGAEFRHPDDLEYGENLAWHSRNTSSCSKLVKMWYDELPLYRFENPVFSHETGHFTQLVWNETERVGCASSISNGSRGGIYLVCNYDPPGNFLGEFPQNVRRAQLPKTGSNNPTVTNQSATTTTTTPAPTLKPKSETTTTTTTSLSTSPIQNTNSIGRSSNPILPTSSVTKPASNSTSTGQQANSTNNKNKRKKKKNKKKKKKKPKKPSSSSTTARPANTSNHKPDTTTTTTTSATTTSTTTSSTRKPRDKRDKDKEKPKRRVSMNRPDIETTQTRLASLLIRNPRELLL